MSASQEKLYGEIPAKIFDTDNGRSPLVVLHLTKLATISQGDDPWVDFLNLGLVVTTKAGSEIRSLRPSLSGPNQQREFVRGFVFDSETVLDSDSINLICEHLLKFARRVGANISSISVVTRVPQNSEHRTK